MKIYTRTGDSGSTGLFGGPRVSKDDIRIEAYGTVDELNAFLGAARAVSDVPGVDERLAKIQHELFSIGAELATPKADEHGLQVVGDLHVVCLENWIDEYESELPPLRNFILPAGSPASSAVHVARAVSRRAERRVVTLGTEIEGSVSDGLIRYLNRLSDFLFVLSRYLNHANGPGDVVWINPAAAD